MVQGRTTKTVRPVNSICTCSKMSFINSQFQTTKWSTNCHIYFATSNYPWLFGGQADNLVHVICSWVGSDCYHTDTYYVFSLNFCYKVLFSYKPLARTRQEKRTHSVISACFPRPHETVILKVVPIQKTSQTLKAHQTLKRPSPL